MNEAVALDDERIKSGAEIKLWPNHYPKLPLSLDFLSSCFCVDLINEYQLYCMMQPNSFLSLTVKIQPKLVLSLAVILNQTFISIVLVFSPSKIQR